MKDLYRGKKPNAAFGVACFFARVNSQTRTVGALLPACAGCLLVIAAKNQMPPSASLVFLLAYIIS